MGQKKDKHILLVENEEHLLKICDFMLKKDGFIVSTAKDGREAFNIISSRKSLLLSIDLLITDLNMPEMSGLDLIDEMNKENIEIPVLTMSGNLDDSLLALLTQRGCTNILEKPFKPGEFLSHVHSAMESEKIMPLCNTEVIEDSGRDF